MLKIAEMSIGSTITADLLVKEASVKYTKSQKPYLYVVLTDGTEDLKGQDWDWGDPARTTPAPGIVVEVTGSISEYMGTKQIKLNRIARSEVPVDIFAPQADISITDLWTEARVIANKISNPTLKKLVSDIYSDFDSEIKRIPAAVGVHHAYVGGLLHHTVNVTKKALAIAECTPEANNDLVIAGALLHDIGKLETYRLNGALIEMTDEGQMMEHIMLGAILSERYRDDSNGKVVDLIQHIISSHHGKHEYGSPTTPLFIEAVIVNYADGVDAKVQTILEAHKTEDKMTDKVWTMNNKRMFSRHYIHSIIEGE